MAQDFGFTGVLGKQAHSGLRNCFSSATVESKDKSDSGIIEFSFPNRQGYYFNKVFQQYPNESGTDAYQILIGDNWVPYADIIDRRPYCAVFPLYELIHGQ